MKVDDIVEKLLDGYYTEVDENKRTPRNQELLDELNNKNIDFEQVVSELISKLDGPTLAVLSPFELRIYDEFLDNLEQKVADDSRMNNDRKLDVRDTISSYRDTVKGIERGKTMEIRSIQRESQTLVEEFNEILDNIKIHREAAMRAGYLAGLPRSARNHDFDFAIDDEDILEVEKLPIDHSFFDEYAKDNKLKAIHDKNARVTNRPVEGESEEIKKQRAIKAGYNSDYIAELTYIKERVAELNALRNQYLEYQERLTLLREGGEIVGYYENLNLGKMPKFEAPERNKEIKAIHDRLSKKYKTIAGRIHKLEDIESLSADELTIMCEKLAQMNKDNAFRKEIDRARALSGSGPEAQELFNKINMINGLYWQTRRTAESVLEKKKVENKEKIKLNEEILKYKYILGFPEVDYIAIEKFAKENGRKPIVLTAEEAANKERIAKGNDTLRNYYLNKLAIAEEKLLNEYNETKAKTEPKAEEKKEEKKEEPKTKVAEKTEDEPTLPEELEDDEPTLPDELKDDEELGVKNKTSEEKPKEKNRIRLTPKVKGKIHRAARALMVVGGLVAAGVGIVALFSGAVGTAVTASMVDLGLAGLLKTGLVGAAVGSTMKKK